MSEQDASNPEPSEQPEGQQDEHTDEQHASEPEQDTDEATDEHGEPDQDDDGDESTDWKSEASKWKSEARKAQRLLKKETGARDELETLRGQVAEQDAAAVEQASDLAAQQLHTKLARAGLSEQDAESLIEHIDSTRLIEDGKPSSKSIDSLAASLSRSLHRGVDDDQGQHTDGPSYSADQWLRRKARR